MANKKKIIILGGGTAGWMAANMFAKRWSEDVDICLLESPDIGIVGVGEGSTPQLKAFFDYIDVAESDWMPACNATFKNGITFNGWSTKPGFESYFHPFPAKTDSETTQAFVYNAYLRRHQLNVPAHPNRYFLPAYLAEHGLGPVPNHNFPFPVSYGYHFDSYLLGQYLRDIATQRSVAHVQGKVAEVVLNDSGDIDALLTDDSRRIEGDFFIDCTGFVGLLIQKTLGVPFVSFSENLFNDAAVVMPSAAAAEPNSHTISTAMKYGWAWDIPLTTRTGNGYVYSSSYCSADQAESELRQKLGLLDSEQVARHLKMNVGRVEQHWYRNCLAVGLSQGFIEPLEATALHLVQDTIQGFMDVYKLGHYREAEQRDFNARVNARFEGIRDYIVCHYRINSRTDTEYWKDNATNEHLSTSLKGVLKTWLNRDDLSLELQHQDITHYYSSVSWHCMLAGYGIFPPVDSLNTDDERMKRHDMRHIDDFISRCGTNFRKHALQLSGSR